MIVSILFGKKSRTEKRGGEGGTSKMVIGGGRRGRSASKGVGNPAVTRSARNLHKNDKENWKGDWNFSTAKWSLKKVRHFNRQLTSEVTESLHALQKFERSSFKGGQKSLKGGKKRRVRTAKFKNPNEGIEEENIREGLRKRERNRRTS